MSIVIKLQDENDIKDFDVVTDAIASALFERIKETLKDEGISRFVAKHFTAVNSDFTKAVKQFPAYAQKIVNESMKKVYNAYLENTERIKKELENDEQTDTNS